LNALDFKILKEALTSLEFKP